MNIRDFELGQLRRNGKQSTWLEIAN